jgi:hypothetical protein
MISLSGKRFTMKGPLHRIRIGLTFFGLVAAVFISSARANFPELGFVPLICK